MSDNPFRKQAEELIENVAELQKHVLLKHSAGLLAAIYEEREKWKHRAESSERALAAERERADRNQEDAERYRWLKDGVWDDRLTRIIELRMNAIWDAAIDAARRK